MATEKELEEKGQKIEKEKKLLAKKCEKQGEEYTLGIFPADPFSEDCIQYYFKKAEASENKVFKALSKPATGVALGFAGINNAIGVANKVVSTTNDVLGTYDAAVGQVNDIINDINGMLSAVGPKCVPTADGKVQEPAATPPLDCNFGMWGIFKSKSLTEALALLGRTQSLSDCASPYFERFFNIIPVHYLLTLILKNLLLDLVNALGPEKATKMLGSTEVCGLQDVEMLRHGQLSKLPSLGWRLPPIPYLPQFDLLAFIHQLIIDAMCGAICEMLSPIVQKIGDYVLKLEEELLDSDHSGATTWTSRTGPTLEKIDLSVVVPNSVLRGAITSGLVAEVQIAQIKNYLESVHENKDLSARQIVYLLMGTASCSVMNILIDIGAVHADLGLTTEERILAFFKYLGSNLNLLQLVRESRVDCPPKICADEDALADELMAAIKDICSLLTKPDPMDILSMLPPVDDMLDHALANAGSPGLMDQVRNLEIKDKDNSPVVDEGGNAIEHPFKDKSATEIAAMHSKYALECDIDEDCLKGKKLKPGDTPPKCYDGACVEQIYAAAEKVYESATADHFLKIAAAACSAQGKGSAPCLALSAHQEGNMPLFEKIINKLYGKCQSTAACPPGFQCMASRCVKLKTFNPEDWWADPDPNAYVVGGKWTGADAPEGELGWPCNENSDCKSNSCNTDMYTCYGILDGPCVHNSHCPAGSRCKDVANSCDSQGLCSKMGKCVSDNAGKKINEKCNGQDCEAGLACKMTGPPKGNICL